MNFLHFLPSRSSFFGARMHPLSSPPTRKERGPHGEGPASFSPQGPPPSSSYSHFTLVAANCYLQNGSKMFLSLSLSSVVVGSRMGAAFNEGSRSVGWEGMLQIPDPCPKTLLSSAACTRIESKSEPCLSVGRSVVTVVVALSLTRSRP